MIVGRPTKPMIIIWKLSWIDTDEENEGQTGDKKDDRPSGEQPEQQSPVKRMPTSTSDKYQGGTYNSINNKISIRSITSVDGHPVDVGASIAEMGLTAQNIETETLPQQTVVPAVAASRSHNVDTKYNRVLRTLPGDWATTLKRIMEESSYLSWYECYMPQLFCGV